MIFFNHKQLKSGRGLDNLSNYPSPRFKTNEIGLHPFFERLRHNGISPRLCKRHSLNVREALPFNPLMRNFKLNSVFYERERRTFDRIELRRRSRRKDENPKRDRRSRADSVKTSRTTTVVCVPLKTSMSRSFTVEGRGRQSQVSPRAESRIADGEVGYRRPQSPVSISKSPNSIRSKSRIRFQKSRIAEGGLWVHRCVSGGYTGVYQVGTHLCIELVHRSLRKRHRVFGIKT